ncbi:MAG: HNH endonuclease [Betaproteobacteria bacterium]|nr:HNH endonuclease [Betaproteobacteria bacterium]
MGAKAAWPALWTVCDDRGVFDWKPKSLKAAIFPGESLDFALILEEWKQLGVVQIIEIQGKRLGLVKNFCKFQSPKFPAYKYELTDSQLAFVAFESGEKGEESIRKRKWREQNGQCFYCSAQISHYHKRHDSLEIDHNIPRSRGGADDDSNLVAACRNCNRTKDALTGEEFMRKIGRSNAIPEIADAKTCDEPRQQARFLHGVGEERRGEGDNISSPSVPTTRATNIGTPAAPVGGESAPSGEDDGSDFQVFWTSYPPEARTAPDYARKAYAKALQLGATPERILAALRRDMERAGSRQPLAPAAWLKGGSWRIEDEPAAVAPPRGNVAPIDPRFDGWEIDDHMALRRWRAARENHWVTPDPRRNALHEDERRIDLWDTITSNRPKVARFLAQHDSEGVPLHGDVALSAAGTA